MNPSRSSVEWRAHSNFIEGAPTRHSMANASAAFTHSAPAQWSASSGGTRQGEGEFDTDVADFVQKEVSLFDRQHVREKPFNKDEDTASKERDYDSQSSAPSCWGRDGEGLGIKSAAEAPTPRAVHANFFEKPQASQAFKKNNSKEHAEQEE